MNTFAQFFSVKGLARHLVQPVLAMCALVALYRSPDTSGHLIGALALGVLAGLWFDLYSRPAPSLFWFRIETLMRLTVVGAACYLAEQTSYNRYIVLAALLAVQAFEVEIQKSGPSTNAQTLSMAMVVFIALELVWLSLYSFEWIPMPLWALGLGLCTTVWWIRESLWNSLTLERELSAGQMKMLWPAFAKKHPPAKYWTLATEHLHYKSLNGYPWTECDVQSIVNAVPMDYLVAYFTEVYPQNPSSKYLENELHAAFFKQTKNKTIELDGSMELTWSMTGMHPKEAMGMWTQGKALGAPSGEVVELPVLLLH